MGSGARREDPDALGLDAFAGTAPNTNAPITTVIAMMTRVFDIKRAIIM
ncbi:MAG TPA: hypothetical protein VGG17_03650 [Acidimicrobiales bacterium]|jgi:hypothetical protein